MNTVISQIYYSSIPCISSFYIPVIVSYGVQSRSGHWLLSGLKQFYMHPILKSFQSVYDLNKVSMTKQKVVDMWY